MTQTNNPHLPKIPWIKRYQGKREGIPQEFFVTIIERLSPLMSRDIVDIGDVGVLLGLLEYATLEPTTTTALERSNKLPMHDGPALQELMNKNKNHPFIKVLRAIDKLGGKCRFDLHDENFMVRADGTVVITDPIA